MSKTFKIDYRSGVESEQVAQSPEDALQAEYREAGADMPEIEQTFSGGDWDFAIYDVAEPQCPAFTTYLKVA